MPATFQVSGRKIFRPERRGGRPVSGPVAGVKSTLHPAFDLVLDRALCGAQEEGERDQARAVDQQFNAKQDAQQAQRHGREIGKDVTRQKHGNGARQEHQPEKRRDHDL